MASVQLTANISVMDRCRHFVNYTAQESSAASVAAHIIPNTSPCEQDLKCARTTSPDSSRRCQFSHLLLP